jgi:hypothetical protein
MRIRKLRICEFIQRAELGGHPAPNDAGFGHGESVVVMSKRELSRLARLIKAVDVVDGADPDFVRKGLEQLRDLGKDFVIPPEDD